MEHPLHRHPTEFSLCSPHRHCQDMRRPPAVARCALRCTAFPAMWLMTTRRHAHARNPVVDLNIRLLRTPTTSGAKRGGIFGRARNGPACRLPSSLRALGHGNKMRMSHPTHRVCGQFVCLCLSLSLFLPCCLSANLKHIAALRNGVHEAASMNLRGCSTTTVIAQLGHNNGSCGRIRATGCGTFISAPGREGSPPKLEWADDLRPGIGPMRSHTHSTAMPLCGTKSGPEHASIAHFLSS